MMRLLLLLLLAFSSTFSFSQTVSTWAGKAKTSGTTSNGSGSGAVRFNEPWGMTYDRQGNLWVTNAGSHSVFMMQASDSKFYVRAGKQNSSGYVNASGINAQFSQPMGITIGAKIYIADAGNHCIRQMDTFKALGTIQAVSLLAGKNGTSGHKDGTGSAAQFDTPTDVAVDTKGNIYVADQGNHCIRKITIAGVVTTYAGQVGSSGSANGDKDSKAKFNWPTGLFIDENDNIYVADKNNYKIRKIDASTGNVSTVYTTANFQTPEQVYVAPNGTVVASGGCQIQAFLGTDTLFLGNHPRNCGFKNDNDTNALLDDARGILPLSTTDFIFLDRDNHIIRKIAVDPCDVIKASITAGGATRFCEGSSVTLSSSPLVSNKWTWSSGSSSSSSVKADKNGYYKLEISAVISGSTCTDTTGIFVTVDDNPTPNISTTGSLTFCPGGEVDLEADQAYSKYNWTTTESTMSIKVKTAGIIGLEVTDANGCVGKATDVVTSLHPTIDPTIIANGAADFCDGGSVELEASAGFISYLWSESSTGAKITVSASGSYTVTATDNNSCETTSGAFDITVYPLPTKPSIASDNDSVYTDATATEYIWYYEGTELKRTSVAYIIADKDGNYEVEVVDDKGCSSPASDMENVTIIGLNKSTQETAIVYPNPSSGIFNVPSAWTGATYSVIDLTGRKVISGTLNTPQIDLKELNEGTYLLRANVGEKAQITRLIIKR